MSKKAVIATSTGCLDYLDLNEENLRILRMKIIMGDDTYNDFIDITADAFYKRLLEDDKLVPQSSMPSPGELLELIDELEEKGYDEVFVTTIGSGMSSTYDVCLGVQSTYDGKVKIHVIDSRNAAISEGWIALEILRLIKEDKSTEEIIEYIEFIRTNRKQYFMVDNLRLFVANGRLTGAAGFIGSMLKIKPILEVDDTGHIVPFKKIRTQKKALKEMVDLVISDLANIDDFVVTYDTSDNLEGLQYIKDEMEKAYPGYKYYEAPITPVIGCHTGVGTVGIAYFDLTKK
ncbi:DegV domain-containing protein [Candidatus Izimaplasma bacterium HR1]|jgi:DegV family protein with EDD domain|uniref:DegV family protein n=1 Tax=Candidatus Izimoplasma sp. HR1 TaxID=1541959 RepID=UPI0004F856E2|nr:DegV domain-containing protein [Candidatus Izimaplasma bacterium HR1]